MFRSFKWLLASNEFLFNLLILVSSVSIIYVANELNSIFVGIIVVFSFIAFFYANVSNNYSKFGFLCLTFRNLDDDSHISIKKNAEKIKYAEVESFFLSSRLTIAFFSEEDMIMFRLLYPNAVVCIV